MFGIFQAWVPNSTESHPKFLRREYKLQKVEDGLNLSGPRSPASLAAFRVPAQETVGGRADGTAWGRKRTIGILRKRGILGRKGAWSGACCHGCSTNSVIRQSQNRTDELLPTLQVLPICNASSIIYQIDDAPFWISYQTGGWCLEDPLLCQQQALFHGHKVSGGVLHCWGVISDMSEACSVCFRLWFSASRFW